MTSHVSESRDVTILPLEQRTLKSAHYLVKKISIYTVFEASLNPIQNAQTFVREKDHSGRRVQQIISMSAQIVCSVDRKMQILMTVRFNDPKKISRLPLKPESSNSMKI